MKNKKEINKILETCDKNSDFLDNKLSKIEIVDGIENDIDTKNTNDLLQSGLRRDVRERCKSPLGYVSENWSINDIVAAEQAQCTYVLMAMLQISYTNSKNANFVKWTQWQQQLIQIPVAYHIVYRKALYSTKNVSYKPSVDVIVITVQIIAWFLYSGVVLCAVFYSWYGIKHLTAMVYSSIGIVAFISQFLLILSIYYYSSTHIMGTSHIVSKYVHYAQQEEEQEQEKEREREREKEQKVELNEELQEYQKDTKYKKNIYTQKKKKKEIDLHKTIQLLDATSKGKNKPQISWRGVILIFTIQIFFSMQLSQFLDFITVPDQHDHNTWLRHNLFTSIAISTVQISVPFTHVIAGLRLYNEGVEATAHRVDTKINGKDKLQDILDTTMDKKDSFDDLFNKIDDRDKLNVSDKMNDKGELQDILDTKMDKKDSFNGLFDKIDDRDKLNVSDKTNNKDNKLHGNKKNKRLKSIKNTVVISQIGAWILWILALLCSFLTIECNYHQYYYSINKNKNNLASFLETYIHERYIQLENTPSEEVLTYIQRIIRIDFWLLLRFISRKLSYSSLLAIASQLLLLFSLYYYDSSVNAARYKSKVLEYPNVTTTTTTTTTTNDIGTSTTNSKNNNNDNNTNESTTTTINSNNTINSEIVMDDNSWLKTKYIKKYITVKNSNSINNYTIYTPSIVREPLYAYEMLRSLFSYTTIYKIFIFLFTFLQFELPVLASQLLQSPFQSILVLGQFNIYTYILISIMIVYVIYIIYTVYYTEWCYTNDIVSFESREKMIQGYEWRYFFKKSLWWECIELYFKTRYIIHDTDINEQSELEDINNENVIKLKQIMFGYHPHGVYPSGSQWCTKNWIFLQHYKDIVVNIMGASILECLPFICTLFKWSGGRPITNKMIQHTIKSGRSLLLIPGGQSEMKFQDNKNTILYTRHYGFIRICLQNGLPIIPIIVFGEMLSLSLLSIPRIQKWIYKSLRLFLPLPYGRWYTFMPKSLPITVVFGKPFYVKKVQDPTPDEIATYHTEYFSRIKELFYAHRDEAGYPDAKLYLVVASPDGSNLISEAIPDGVSSVC